MESANVFLVSVVSLFMMVASDGAIAQSGPKSAEELATVICSNNGVGNGGEKVIQVLALGSTQRNDSSPNGITYKCEKFTTEVEDLPGQPGQLPFDPNNK